MSGTKLQLAVVVTATEAVGLVVVDRIISTIVLQFVHGASSHGTIVHRLSLSHIRSSLNALSLQEEVGDGRTSSVGFRWNDVRAKVRYADGLLIIKLYSIRRV